MDTTSTKASTVRSVSETQHVQPRKDAATTPLASSTSSEDPYMHSESAMCIRGSEGSFAERRVRLDSAFRNSLKVSKTDLLQRNIYQGVNVVRRASRQLEEKLSTRPPLEELVSKRRLSSDYLDRVFPDRVEDSVAPAAERIERVSLHRLLAPPAKKQGSISAPTVPNSSAPQAPQGGTQLDPAMLAAMVVQAAMMSKTNDSRPTGGMPQQTVSPMPGQMWPGQVGQPRPPYDMSWPKMVNPYLLRPDVAATSPTMGTEKGASSSSTLLGHSPEFPTTPIVERYGPPPSVSGYGAQPTVAKPKPEGSSCSISPPPVGNQGAATRTPKPPVQVTRIESDRSQKPVFLRLLDDFCERQLNKEVSGSTAPQAS